MQEIGSRTAMASGRASSKDSAPIAISADSPPLDDRPLEDPTSYDRFPADRSPGLWKSWVNQLFAPLIQPMDISWANAYHDAVKAHEASQKSFQESSRDKAPQNPDQGPQKSAPRSQKNPSQNNQSRDSQSSARSDAHASNFQKIFEETFRSRNESSSIGWTATDVRMSIDDSVSEAEWVLKELQLRGDLCAADLHRIRRDFAKKHHPDHYPPAEREAATRRMALANRLIDRYLKRK